MEMESILLNKYPSPTDFVIETSTQCNLKCAFCARQFTDMKYEPWTLKQFETVINKLKPYVNIVRLGVQGEPLLNDLNFEFMKFLEKEHIMFSLTTNGLFLNEKAINKFPSNLAVIYDSVDAGSQEIYNIYRDKADFKTWKDNVITFRKLKPNIPLQVNYLLFKKNLYDIPKMIDFCANYGLLLSSTFPVIFTEKFAKEHDAFWLSNLSEIIKINTNYARARRVSYLCSSGNLEWRKCVLPWQQPLIGVQGDVYTDFFIYQPRNYEKGKPIIWQEWFRNEYKDVPQDQYIMGNILEENWKVIWNNYSPFLKYLDKLNNMRYTSKDFRNLRDTTNQFENKWDYCKICGRRWGFSY